MTGFSVAMEPVPELEKKKKNDKVAYLLTVSPYKYQKDT